MTKRIEFTDAGPDKLGRRRFTLHWTDQGEFRNQLHPDGKPVGFRRAQCFFAKPPVLP